MEKSVGSAIEKIKLQEQDNESKLKEKREHEAILVQLNKSLREISSHTEKLAKEKLELQEKIDKLRPELDLARIRHSTLCHQVEISRKELKDLRVMTDQDIAQVWELRSTLCNAVQTVSDDCDVWALLMKPTFSDPSKFVPKSSQANIQDLNMNTEIKLKEVKERKQKALLERDRLLSEPDNGEEFLRFELIFS